MYFRQTIYAVLELAKATKMGCPFSEKIEVRSFKLYDDNLHCALYFHKTYPFQSPWMNSKVTAASERVT